MLMMEHNDCGDDEYWVFEDDEAVVGDYVDLITDYIELVFLEKIDEQNWHVAE